MGEAGEPAREELVEVGNSVCRAWTVRIGRKHKLYASRDTVKSVLEDHVVLEDCYGQEFRTHKRLIKDWLESEERHFHVLDGDCGVLDAATNPGRLKP